MSLQASFNTKQQIIDMVFKPTLVAASSGLAAKVLDKETQYIKFDFIDRPFSPVEMYAILGFVSSFVSTPISIWALPKMKAKYQYLTQNTLNIAIHGGLNAFVAMMLFKNENVVLPTVIAVLSEISAQYAEEIVLPFIK